MRVFTHAMVWAMLFSVETALAAQLTFDLRWRDTGTSTLPFNSIGEISANTGNGCPVIGGSGNLDGYRLDVVVTAIVPFSASVTTLGWSAADSGMTLRTPLPTPSFASGTVGSLSPVSPDYRTVAECPLTNCDTAVGSIGGLGLSNVAAGTYTVGSLSFDLTGIGVDAHEIQTFFITGVDGVLSISGMSTTYLSTELNGAVVSIVPEPGIASLPGLGLSVLGARQKARPRSLG